jgi:hypothetical protein
MSSFTPCKNDDATIASTTNGIIEANANLYARAYISWLVLNAVEIMAAFIPGTALMAACFPDLMAVISSAADDFGSPEPMTAAVLCGPYVDAIFPLMMADRTAEPKAPPIARNENASPVAVDR